MAKLAPVADAALDKTEYQEAIFRCLVGDIEWSHRSLKPLKDSIRTLLRKEQKETCPYCQRLILPERRNWNEHIEHILDKSKEKYKKFLLDALNIVLSCGPCNFEKSTKDLLSLDVVPDDLGTVATSFAWPHPYFDDMAACIRKDPGPVYKPIIGSGREKEALNLIRDLKLDDLASIESRASHLKERRTELLAIMDTLVERWAEKSSRLKIKIHLNEIRRIDLELS